MSLLSKVFGGDKTPAPVGRFDDTLEDPRARQVVLHSRKGDWRKRRYR